MRKLLLGIAAAAAPVAAQTTVPMTGMTTPGVNGSPAAMGTLTADGVTSAPVGTVGPARLPANVGTVGPTGRPQVRTVGPVPPSGVSMDGRLATQDDNVTPGRSDQPRR